jgi:hypothetical protein
MSVYYGRGEYEVSTAPCSVHGSMGLATSISEPCIVFLKCMYMEDLESSLSLTKLLHHGQTI